MTNKINKVNEDGKYLTSPSTRFVVTNFLNSYFILAIKVCDLVG